MKQIFYKIKIHKWTYFYIIKDEHSHPKTLAAFQNFLFNLLNCYNYARVFFFLILNLSETFTLRQETPTPTPPTHTLKQGLCFFWNPNQMLSPCWFQRLQKNSLDPAPSQRSLCGFKGSFPPPPCAHILVLSLHRKCQAVTSTIVSRTPWSLLYRGGKKRERRRVAGEVSASSAMFPADRHFPCSNPDLLFMAVRLIGSPALVSCGAQPPPLLSINHEKLLRSVHRVGALPRVASSCLQLNEMTLCENLFYERLVYL